MTAFRSIISVITAAKRADGNATLNATGTFGPTTYVVGLSADGSWPPTHYGSNHGTTTSAEHELWASLLDGALPTIPGTWGQDGAPTELAAIAAFGGGNVILDCITHTTPEFNTDAHWQGIIGTIGLQVSSPPE